MTKGPMEEAPLVGGEGEGSIIVARAFSDRSLLHHNSRRSSALGAAVVVENAAGAVIGLVHRTLCHGPGRLRDEGSDGRGAAGGFYFLLLSSRRNK